MCEILLLVTVIDTYIEIIPILVETIVNLTNLEKKLYLVGKNPCLMHPVTLFTRVYVVYCALVKVENNLLWGRFRYWLLARE